MSHQSTRVRIALSILAAVLLASGALAQSGIKLPDPRPPDPPPSNPPQPPKIDPPRPPTPDLVISEFKSSARDPSNIVEGSLFAVTAVVKNIDAGGALDVNVRLEFPSSVEVIENTILPSRFAGCTQDGTARVCRDKAQYPPLLYGQSADVVFSVRAKTAGAAGFNARADSLGKVAETSESNNRGSLNVTIVARPALQASVEAPDSSRIDDKFPMSCTVRNIGMVPAKDVDMRVVLKNEDGGNQEFTVKNEAWSSCKAIAFELAAVHTFDCDTGPMAVGPTASVTKTFTVSASEASRIIIECEISAPLENSTGDNRAEKTTRISR